MTREEFTSLVEGTQKEFRRFLTALCCGDSQLADDVAQEAYIKAFLAAEGVRNPESFRAWIFRIGYNTFINHRRTSRTYAALDSVAASVAADDVPPGEGQPYAELYRALGRLNPRERTAILLYYMEGYAVKEIAKITQASEDAVKQQLSRGRTHLRGLMTE